MTTVAYKNGQMACDSCWSDNCVRVVSAIKMRRLSSGALLGEAGDGDIRAVVELLDKAKSYKAMPTKEALEKTRTTFGGILVLPSAQAFLIDIEAIEPNREHYTAQIYELHEGGFAAIGTGREFALGAMAAGKTAKQAVAIACRFDIYSATPVHVMELS